MKEAIPAPPAADPLPKLDIRKVTWQATLAIFVVLGALVLAGKFLWEPVHALAHLFVEHLGGLGVAVGFFLPDGFNVPMPVDIFSTLGWLGGLGFWWVVFCASIGSLSGGCCGFWIGRKLRHTRWFKRLMQGRGAEVHGLVVHYGGQALAIAALTPIPYSIACWSCGALDMRFKRFCLISLLRIPRVAGYLWLIQIGVISFTPGT
jgi:membrane protein YqaA with SNARE-associated domain